MKRYAELPEEKKRRADAMLAASTRLSSAHFLKEELLKICDETDRNEAVKLLSDWICMAETSGLQPFADCAKTSHH